MEFIKKSYMKKNKYSIGYWIIKVIKSCKSKKQLEGAVRLLYLFENNFKYDPTQLLIREIYDVYYKQFKNFNEITFDPDIHL